MDTYLFVAPHPDAVALSVGGLVRALAGRARVVIATVFSRSGRMVEGFAIDRAKEISRRRAEEERRFAARVGVTTVLLDLPDSSLRGYDDDSECTTDPTRDPMRAEVFTVVARLLDDYISARILAPLGIGGHIDHLLTRDAVVAAARAGIDFAFYEDIPFAARADADATGRDRATAYVDASVDLAAKLEDLTVYQSQLTNADTAAVSRRAKEVGGERLWALSRLHARRWRESLFGLGVIARAEDGPTPRHDRYFRHAEAGRICFIYNYRCTAACAHCITESSPKREGRLTRDEVSALLARAAADGRRLAIFSGGEIFLHFDDLCALLEAARALGLRTMVETNAYWATSDRVARAKLERLVEHGLDDFYTSADAYHLPYVPLERVLCAGRAADALGVPYDICFLYSGHEDQDRAILAQLQSAGLHHSKGTVFPFGTGRDLPTHHFVLTDCTRHRDCGDLQPTIAPNGDVVSCCNIHIHTEGSPLFLGNIRKEPLSVLMARFDGNPFVRMIRSRGFGWFHDALSEDPELSLRYRPGRHATICHFCHELFMDPARAAFFAARLAALDGPGSAP